MGWFSRKPKEPEGPLSLDGTTPWRLRGGGSVGFTADEAWVGQIQDTVEKVPRLGHPVMLDLKRDRAGVIHVFHDGIDIGVVSSEDSKQYASAFAHLEKTKRHGRVEGTVRMKGSKATGPSAWFDLCRPNWPAIPFNEPPVDIPRAGDYTEFMVKDEKLFSPFIQRISRGMSASPGWFVIDVANGDGQHPVWAPMPGMSPQQSQVGFINKAGTKQAAALTANGPVYLPGVAFWRDTTPQIELASYQG
jgi:hypothetical protein